MNRFTKFSGASLDRLWLVGLLLAALLLFGFNLGGVPLRDWDEGTVAQVARDIARSPIAAKTWLHPTLAGEPYLFKPPLVHWMMAIAYWIGGVNEWTSRLPGAAVTALSVPLLYRVGRELFPARTPAVFAALVYLTLLPVVRHGRLAMLDGVLVTLFLVLLLCALRSRRDLRWGLGIGLAFGLLCLTKGIVAILLGAIVLGFLAWDTPRLLTSGYLWGGLLLGSVPAIGWYGAQVAHYGQTFFQVNLLSQSLNRVWEPVENNRGPIGFYLLEIVKYSAPWLIFLPGAIHLAWINRSLSWAKLTLLWFGSYLLVISLMQTKLPWYVYPAYPALALLVGARLATLWDSEDWTGFRLLRSPRYPLAWIALFGLLAIGGWAGVAYFGMGASSPQPMLQLCCLAIALTMTSTVVLMRRQDSQFIPVLLWGMYLSLLLFVASDDWVWELNEAYPVKPVAALIQQHVPPGQRVFTSYPNGRPSLDFYSDRPVQPESIPSLRDVWTTRSPAYLLVDEAAIADLKLQDARVLGSAEGWSLLTRSAR